MKIFFLTMLTILIMTSGNCSDKKINLNPSKSNQLISWPLDWSLYLNKKITVKGTAVDAKLGALLLGQGTEIWIDGLDAWPVGFYLGGRQGKLLHVTGIVIERNDLPVFVPKEGEQPKSGIALSKESDLTKTSKRFLLKDASWEIIKN